MERDHLQDSPRLLGKRAEKMALSFLKNKGYKIVGQNYRTKWGEIDLIAEDAGYLVFVEVKARRGLRYGLPQEAITWRKQKQIVRMAQSFVQKKGLHHKAIRFDVVAIIFHPAGKPELEHIPWAFEAA